MISLGTLAGKCRLKNKIISEIFTIKDFDNRIVTFLPGQSLVWKLKKYLVKKKRKLDKK